MKQWNVLLELLILNLLKTLTSGLPYQHLVIYEPSGILAPKESVVATQLQVSPRADGTGNYVFKEVPLISRNLDKEIISADEKIDESKSEMQNDNEKNKAKETAKETDKAKEHVIEKEKLKNTDSAAETVNVAVKEVNEDTKQLADVETSSQSMQQHKVKRPIVVADGGTPIYITIPIYVNSEPGLPLTLSIGTEQTPLKGNRQGAASRKGSLPKAISPTSQYNKLLSSS